MARQLLSCKNECTNPNWASKHTAAESSLDFDSNTGGVCVFTPWDEIRPRRLLQLANVRSNSMAQSDEGNGGTRKELASPGHHVLGLRWGLCIIASSTGEERFLKISIIILQVGQIYRILALEKLAVFDIKQTNKHFSHLLFLQRTWIWFPAPTSGQGITASNSIFRGSKTLFQSLWVLHGCGA